MKLNIGCGTSIYPDFVNIDSEASVNPDLVLNIKETKLPYEDNSVEEIWFIHCIEHLEEKYHAIVLAEFRRVLQPEGRLCLAYPEFIRCASAYIENKRGARDFWKATIYGRQLYPGDYHVSLMDTRYLAQTLQQIGFKEIKYSNEPEPNEINTFLTCIKGEKMLNKEDLLRQEIFG